MALPDPVAAQLMKLMERAASIGLFLVPVGELEGWLSAYGVTASKKESKWAWANEAASRVRELGAPQVGDVWDFMRKVGTFVTP